MGAFPAPHMADRPAAPAPLVEPPYAGRRHRRQHLEQTLDDVKLRLSKRIHKQRKTIVNYSQEKMQLSLIRANDSRRSIQIHTLLLVRVVLIKNTITN